MNLKTILRTRKLNDSVFLRKGKDRNDGTYRGVAGTQVFESYGKKYVEFHDVLFDYDDLEAYLKNQFVESYDDLSNQDFEDFANMDAISALYAVEPSNDDPWEDDDYYGEDLVEEAEFVDVVDSQKVKDGSSEKVSDAETPTWRGVEGSIYRWHGEWADPEVEYRGKLFNETELEDTLWQTYEDDCISEGIEPTEEGFENFATTEFAESVLDAYYNIGGWVEDLEEDEISDSTDKVSDEEDDIENWEDYRFTFTIYGNDGEIIDQFDGTEVYTELSDTLYDDDSAIELAKEALHNYAESYDGEGDKIVISVDADEYDMSADDYSGKVREVYSEEYDLKEDEISDSVDDDVDIDDERTSLWSRTYNKLVNFAINNDMINVPIEVNTEDIKSIKVDDEGYITVITQYGDEDFIENYEDDVMFDIYNKVTNA